jgi:hypothetical protein
MIAGTRHCGHTRCHWCSPPLYPGVELAPGWYSSSMMPGCIVARRQIFNRSSVGRRGNGWKVVRGTLVLSKYWKVFGKDKMSTSEDSLV